MNTSKRSQVESLSLTTEETSCRRTQSRDRIRPATVKCWSDMDRPTQVNSIEVDEHGARLLLPWDAEPGDFVQVSLCDQLGQYDTRPAVVVWARPLLSSNRVVVGLAFADEAMAA